MRRHLIFLYGLLAYAVFLPCLLYAIGFVGGFGVPRTIDRGGPEAPLGEALAIDALLLAVFAVQHSVMARRGFKEWVRQFVSPAVERSTYVLASALALVLLFAQWRPLPGTVWHVDHPAAHAALGALAAGGWALMVASTFMINHFDLFGLRQAWLQWRRREVTDLGFRTPGVYNFMRHPIQTGFLVAFWSTPHMTLGHLVFALGCTAYIAVALRLEERDLTREFGGLYRTYRERVHSFLPIRRYRAAVRWR